MCRREQVDLGGEWSDIGGGAAVDAESLFNNALSHQFFGEAPDRGLDLTVALGEVGGQLGHDAGGGRVQRGVALGLGGDGVRR